MLHRPARLIILMLTLLAGASSYADINSDDDLQALQQLDKGQWQKIREDQLRNITVYSKLEEHSRIRSMKVEAELNATANAISDVLADFDNYPKWFWCLKKSNILRRVSANEFFVHLLFQTPGGLPDRDVVLHYTRQVSADQRTITIHAEAVNDFLPEKKGIVRITKMHNDIEINSISSVKSHFRGEVWVDPGGNVPLWAANFVQRRAPHATMLGLIRMLAL